jgi:hypothetical protein
MKFDSIFDTVRSYLIIFIQSRTLSNIIIKCNWIVLDNIVAARSSGVPLPKIGWCDVSEKGGSGGGLSAMASSADRRKFPCGRTQVGRSKGGPKWRSKGGPRWEEQGDRRG